MIGQWMQEGLLSPAAGANIRMWLDPVYQSVTEQGKNSLQWIREK